MRLWLLACNPANNFPDDSANSAYRKTVMNLNVKTTAKIILASTVLISSQALAQIPSTVYSFTGPWYNPTESGWGLNIVQQGSVIFPTWFTYDADGRPLWLYISGARFSGLGFSGEIYRNTGIPFDQIGGSPSTLTATKIGTAQFFFFDKDNLLFNYTLHGQMQQTKSLKRLKLGEFSPVCVESTGSRANATNYSDIWWNPAESGWGVNLFQQGSVMFGTWFTYGEGNRDKWYVMSRGLRQSDGSFKGELTEATRGVPFTQINAAPALNAADLRTVGELSFRFINGESGIMTYTVDGVTQSKNIRRQVFSAPQQICRSGVAVDLESDWLWPGNPSGGVFGCYGWMGIAQSRRLRRTSTSGAVEYTQRGAGIQGFEGSVTYATDNFDAQNRRFEREFFYLDATQFYNVGKETYDPVSGQLLTRSRYSAHRYPVNQDPEIPVSRTYTLAQLVSTPGNEQPPITFDELLTRRSNEAVTTAAGTFPEVCSFDTKTDSTIVQGAFIGQTSTVRRETRSWTSPDVGTIKTETKISTMVNGVFVPSGTESTELLNFTTTPL